MATNAITDDELREQLQELGENVGPVTSTTRSLLLRRLKKLQKNGTTAAKSPKKDARRKSTPAKGRRGPSRKLIGFSSDEEGDNSGTRTRRRHSTGRTQLPKKEEVSSHDDLDGGRRLQSNAKGRGNSTVRSVSPTIGNESNIGDEFSDADSSAYTGPFQRGAFRFRSFRRKKESPESGRYRLREPGPDERPQDGTVGQDIPDGTYQFPKKTTSSLSIFNTLAFVVVLICAVILAVLYLDLLPPDKFRIASNQPDPICKNKKLSVFCMDKLKEHYAFQLYDNLSKKAGYYDCGDESVKTRNMSSSELLLKINSDNKNTQPRFLDVTIKNIYKSILKFVQENEDFGIRMYNKDNVLVNDTDEVKWLESIKPHKTLLCRIKQSFTKIISVILIIACGLVVLIGVYLVVRTRWQKEEKDTRLMYMFVEKIIDILRKHHESCKTDKELPPYLPIPHVRDMLIKPTDRQSMAKTWSRAVRFLSANESRIRVESQRIAGEDFEVWRWIHILSPKHHSHKVSVQESKKPKCWQGQAFENFQWAVNPPIISPTPCLKIRNMFDPDVELEENWHVIIQDAILEKSIDVGANVVHMAVDKSSSEGCVYVKCDSHTSAGAAFKCLHGSWFDGRLVAVKYLTLRRYHQRFPKALTATEALQPSGTTPSSLVTLEPEDNMDVNDSETEV